MHRIETVLAGLGAPARMAFLVLVSLAAFLPGFFNLPPVDRDEARFAQTSRQMLASGDLVDLRFQDGTRYKKPAGIYWLQSVAVALTGPTEDAAIWRYRLPSLLAAVLSVLLTARLAGRLSGPEAALPAGLLMATVFVLGAEARLAKTDAAVLLTVLVAMGPLIEAYRGERLGWGGILAFWAALGVSALIKGPIGPMVVLLAAAALAVLSRRLHWLLALRPLPGLALLMAIVVPWYAAISLRAGQAFWDEALGRDLIGKLQSAQESHGAPPGSYLVALWLAFFPASAALALTLPQIWAQRRSQLMLIAAAWVVPGWLVFEAAPTKLLHYTLPFYPALALLIAAVWPLAVAGPRRWALVAAGLVMLLPYAVMTALAVYAQGLGGIPVAPLAMAALISLAGAAIAVFALTRRLPLVALCGLCLAGIGLQVALFPTAAAVPRLWPAPTVVAALPVNGACPRPTLHAAGYTEASLVFLAPGPVVWTAPEDAAAALQTDPCAAALLPTDAGFAPPPGIATIARIQGLNLGSGKPVDLTLWGRQP